MCGILGGSKKEWKYKDALDVIRHRGPDGARIKNFDRFTMGFVRLAIMDLSDKGMQPMISADENVAVTYNGEIYGFNRLKKKLERQGHRFISTSDTEVILHAYEEYGESFVHHIDGIFAIAVYDRREEKLKLFRDRAGVKPLYYYYDGKDFAYCSELKGIEALCHDRNFKLDYTALYDYLTYTYIPEPKTMYLQVYKLPPACMLIWDVASGKIVKKARYWKLKINEQEGDRPGTEEQQEEIRNLIHQAVREQMVADVPVGSFLSGGIDSSIITYEVYRNNPSLSAFSIGFTDKKYDELRYANMLADAFGIEKKQQIVDKKLYKTLYSDLCQWYDEPYADMSAFPTFLVSKLAREKVTVVLTGDGGDEVFGGYLRYLDFIEKKIGRNIQNRALSTIYEKMLHLPTEYKIDGYMQEDVARICSLYGYMQIRDKKKYARAWGIEKDYDDYWYFRKYYIKDLPPITRMQYLDFHTYLPSDVLTKVDRASMQVSLEARVPLLSKKIIEYAFSLSQKERIGGGELKDILKKAYTGILPKEILYRRKMGFGVPANYLSGHGTQQEELLSGIWHIGV